jgi:hypothetical protein
MHDNNAGTFVRIVRRTSKFLSLQQVNTTAAMIEVKTDVVDTQERSHIPYSGR